MVGGATSPSVTRAFCSEFIFYREPIFARRCALSEAPGKATQPDAPDAKADISRRDLFAKIGMALNGLAVVVLATPVVGYLLAPILRARTRPVSALGYVGRSG